MSNLNALETVYGQYLQSQLDPQIGAELSTILHSVGMLDEAAALDAYFVNQQEATYIWQGGDLAGRRCYANPHLPSSSVFGDLWFDVIELTPMIFVPNLEGHSERAAGWIALRPVYVWQFRAFMQSARYTTKDSSMIDSPMMATERFTAMNATAFVTNLYWEEATAYARWFRKRMTGGSQLKTARASLPDAAFAQVLPAELRFWEGGVHDGLLYECSAIGRDSIDKSMSFWEEDDLLASGQRLDTADRRLFSWTDRSDEIGFSTWVNKSGLYELITSKLIYDTVTLLDTAYRPPITTSPHVDDPDQQ